MHASALPLTSHSTSLSRAERHALEMQFERPTLVMDLDAVARRYAALAQGLGRAHIHYAVKANPEPAIIARLAQIGSGFDAASRAEIELCLSQGAAPERITFGNTIKRPADIAFAHAVGISQFAADAEEELEKIATHAPGAEVCLRLIVENCEADWPLTRKFGAAPEKVLPLWDYARALGLRPIGLSFHVGSQTREPAMWSGVLDQVAEVWRSLQGAGHAPELLNIGGGFPARYDQVLSAPDLYAAEVVSLVEARFPGLPRIMAEPGRALVAEAGAIAAEVLLVSQKHDNDSHRWVFLDIGRFSGLAETEGEAIRYEMLSERMSEPHGPCVLAGPSCDSVDVLYEKRPVSLPLGLKAGDKIVLRATGAYTASYASVGFNGIPPLEVVVI